MTDRLAVGALVAGRIRLERFLGRGGMGEVWAAKHEVPGKRCALKFLHGSGAPGETQLQRFAREARAACTIDHPGVIDVHDVFALDDGAPVMVMELLDGETLAAKLQRDAPLPVGEAADLLMQIASAIGAAHAAGVVHRDIKPSNIFLVASEGDTAVKVLDFGIAKLLSNADPATTTGRVVGTPAYMAPEQLRGERDIDHRADIWAMGVLVYEMLSAKRPLEGHSVGEIVEQLLTEGVPPLRVLAPEAPHDLAVVARSMLERDRVRRPDDLRAFTGVLKKYTERQIRLFGPAVSSTEPAPDAADEHRVRAPVANPSLDAPRERPTRARGLVAIGALAIAAAFYAGTTWRAADDRPDTSSAPATTEVPPPPPDTTPPPTSAATSAPAAPTTTASVATAAPTARPASPPRATPPTTARPVASSTPVPAPPPVPTARPATSVPTIIEEPP